MWHSVLSPNQRLASWGECCRGKGRVLGVSSGSFLLPLFPDDDEISVPHLGEGGGVCGHRLLCLVAPRLPGTAELECRVTCTQPLSSARCLWAP